MYRCGYAVVVHDSDEESEESLSDAFTVYLENLKVNLNLRFDNNKFVNCSDAESNLCASLMVENAIKYPKIISKCTKLAKTINSITVNKFGDQLSETCNFEITSRCERVSRPTWPPIRNLGVFMGQLHIIGMLSKALLRKWIASVQVHVQRKHYVATTALLDVLMVVLDSMKKSDITSFYAFVLQLQSLSASGITYPKHHKWIEHVLKNNLANAQGQTLQMRASSAPSTSAATPFVPQLTGAIPKT